MAKTVAGVMDSFSEAQATVRDLSAAGIRSEDINLIASEGGATLVSATVASEEMAARAEEILGQRRAISAENQATLNERLYHPGHDGPDRRTATSPHTGTERRRII